MSYVVKCQVCDHRMQVSDPRVPPDIQCPECGSFYCLFPVTDRPGPYVPRFLRDLGFDPTAPTARATGGAAINHSAIVVLTPLNRPVPQPAAPRVAATAAVTRPVPATRRVPAAFEPADDRPAIFSLPNPLGPGSTLVGGAALACVVTGCFPLLVVPLAGAGVLLGLVTVLLTGGARGSRLWPLAGTVAAGLALAADLGRSPARPGTHAGAAVRVVPLTGHDLPADLVTAEWVDASRAALQQDQIGVQVVGVALGPVEIQTGPRKRTVTPEKYLVVRVRVQRVVGRLTLKADAADEPDPPFGHQRATLTDEAGTACRSAPFEVNVDGPAAAGAADEVFVFEAPPAGAGPLRLEIPAAAWGGTGSFRFGLPGSMIRSGLIRGGRPSGP